MNDLIERTKEKFCKVCNEPALMRMQTTEYEDWFCKTHYGEAMDSIMKAKELRIRLK